MAKHKQYSMPERVGLDIGSHSIKAVEVVERGAELVVRSAGSVSTGYMKNGEKRDSSSLASAIKGLWSSAGIQSDQVIMCPPSDSVYTKWLNLQVNDNEDLDYTARSTAARGAPFPPEDAIVDYRVLSSRGYKAEDVKFTMLVAASQKSIDELLGVAEKAGLDPVAVDVPSVATLRGIEAQRQIDSLLWNGQPLAHCLIGAKNTTIVIKRNGELEFARTVPVGGDDFTHAIAEYAEISFQEADKLKQQPGSRLTEDATFIASNGDMHVRVACENVVGRLAREIQRSLRFFSSQFAEGSYLGMVGSATVSGGGALLKGLDVCLEKHDVDIAGFINPFAGFSVEATNGIERVWESAPAYTTAMGLALGDYCSEMKQKDKAAA